MSTKTKPAGDASKPTPNKANHDRKNGSTEDLNIDLEIRDCQKFGYCLMRKFLGKGNYAKVYLASPSVDKLRSNYKLRLLQKKDEMIKVAIKIINLETVSKTYVTKFLPREVATMSINYEHPNVIKLLDFFVTSRRVYIIMEYADGGDLLDYVNNSYMKKKDGSTKKGISEQEAKVIFAHIMAGVRYIHSNDVAHRDLKFENILLCGKNNIPKLSDFGFALKKNEKEDLQNTHCGSYAYAAPEVLRRESYESKASDIWSLGIMLFALVQGFLPFKESTAKGVLEAMKKTIYLRPSVSAEYKQLIKGLLRKTPKTRMTSDQIVNHAWLMEDCGSDEKADGDTGEGKATIKCHIVKPVSVRPHRPSKLDRAEFVSGCIKRVLRNADHRTTPTKPPTKNLPSLKDHEKRVVEVEKRLSRENGTIKRIISSKSQMVKKLQPLPIKHRPLDSAHEQAAPANTPRGTPMPPTVQAPIESATTQKSSGQSVAKKTMSKSPKNSSSSTSRKVTTHHQPKTAAPSARVSNCRTPSKSTNHSCQKHQTPTVKKSLKPTNTNEGRDQLRTKKSPTTTSSKKGPLNSISGPRITISHQSDTGKPIRRPLSAATLLNSGAQRIGTVPNSSRQRRDEKAIKSTKKTEISTKVPSPPKTERHGRAHVSHLKGKCCKEGCECSERGSSWSNNPMASPFRAPSSPWRSSAGEPDASYRHKKTAK